MNGQFLKFLLTGGIAAAVNLGCRYGMNRYMPFEVAVVPAYLAGMATAYMLARHFVFQASGRSIASEFRRFALVNVASLALVWLVSVGLARLIFPAFGFAWHVEDISHIIGVAAPAVMSFFGHRLYTFGRHAVIDEKAALRAANGRQC